MTELSEVKQIEEKFWNNVEIGNKDDCWNWEAWCDNDGYGKVQFRIDGKKMHQRAHRVSFCLDKNIDIPSSLIIRHTCHNPSCVNPNHLEGGTHQDNIDDKIEANRQAKGEKNGRSKLSANEVKNIRKEYSKFVNSQLEKFNVTQRTIRNVHRGEIWKHVIE